MKAVSTRLFLMLIVASLTAACTVQWVSNYDPVTDRNVTALQKKVSSDLLALGGQTTPECLYPAHEAFYVDAQSDAHVILTRAEALNVDGLNQLTVDQITLTTNSLTELQDLHRTLSEGENPVCISEGTQEELVEAFDTAFRAILTFELAKRRQLTRAETTSEGD